jgi:beta-mannosidase
MRTTHDLGDLDWTVAGWTPYFWRLARAVETGTVSGADVPAIPAPVPGSVQIALLDAGEIPDWNVGQQSRASEWVEHRHWIYQTTIPDEWVADEWVADEWVAADATVRLRCLGLDYSGWILLNGEEIAEFSGTHRPHVVDLTGRLAASGNRLAIVFDLPPRWLGQFGYTSRVTEWKTRFNYTWDWQPRLVQIGIWDTISLEVVHGAELGVVRSHGDADPEAATGVLRVGGEASAGTVDIELRDGERVIRSESIDAAAFAEGVQWAGLPVELWWPNGQGAQPLYGLSVALRDAAGAEQDRVDRRVGFRHIEWRQCDDAPADADPWLCVVNGRPVFLQGVNCPPMLPNFADTTAEAYRTRVAQYRDLGLNTFRINGCGFLEKEVFYDACDEAGILIWQDCPLSSSGLDNVPPTDAGSIEAFAAILTSYIERRAHHPAVLLWSGGNELATVEEGISTPISLRHPLIARLAGVVAQLDPARRFLPGSPTGHRYTADPAEFGTGVHGNVHGPWRPPEADLASWRDYWDRLDAVFSAEMGAPGAAPADVIRQYLGDLEALPVSEDNPAWRRPFTMWIEDDEFRELHGRDPGSLEEYVAWSQARQAEALSYAVRVRKADFPRNGGVLIWCGHDCYPCSTNTSLIDFHGTPKPAAAALSEVWRSPQPAVS